VETNTTTVYTSIRQAALSINSDIKTLLRRENALHKKRKAQATL